MIDSRLWAGARMVTFEVVEAVERAGWTVDAELRVRDDEGALVGLLDAELAASLVEFFDVTPVAEA